MSSLDLDDLDLEEKRLIKTPPELALCLRENSTVLRDMLTAS